MPGIPTIRKNFRVAGVAGREYDKSYSDRTRTDSPMPSSAVTRTRTDSGDTFAFDDPMLSEKTDFVTQKFTGPSFFNRSGYSDVDPRTGQIKQGIGGKILGGILSLVTGIPGLGFGLDYLRNKFSPRPRDMSTFNELGLLTDRTISGPSTNPIFQNDLNNILLEQLAEEDDEYERDLSQIGQDARFIGFGFDELNKLKSGQKQYMPGENIAYGLEKIFNRR
jgi:hypothetical protein